jgi:hypothetical protein
VPGAPFLEPFVLSVAESPRRREGRVDVYPPVDIGERPAGAVVFVHGGPLPEEIRPTPRDWPVYVGYGSLAARQGLAGVTVDHPLHDPADYAASATALALAVARVRALDVVDSARVVLWFFSGGGLLSADWLAQPPEWLCGLAFSYPLLGPLPGWDVEARFRPAEAVRAAGSVPILLTRVGRERPEVATTVSAFIEEAEKHETALDVIDLPDGQHAFDMLDPTDASRSAVTEAMAWVKTALAR